MLPVHPRRRQDLDGRDIHRTHGSGRVAQRGESLARARQRLDGRKKVLCRVLMAAGFGDRAEDVVVEISEGESTDGRGC
eukprot:3184019-Prymnesium_polylepis.1